jgi:rhodanese-related sulfurtransferase
MKKPFFICLFQPRAAAIFLFAICSVFPMKSLVNDPLAVNFEEQEPAPVGESSRPDVAPPKTPIVHPEVPRISANELKELLAKKADIVLVDVNPRDSFGSFHIPSAVNIPYASNKGTAERDAMLAQLPKNKLIVLYCFCEEGADSSEVALILRRLGYRRDKVKVLEGGLIKWDEKGYPMIKTEVPE